MSRESVCGMCVYLYLHVCVCMQVCVSICERMSGMCVCVYACVFMYVWCAIVCE